MVTPINLPFSKKNVHYWLIFTGVGYSGWGPSRDFWGESVDFSKKLGANGVYKHTWQKIIKSEFYMDVFPKF